MEDRRAKIELAKNKSEDTGAHSGVVSSVVTGKSLASTNDTAAIGPGAILDAKYLVGSVIGEGAFGVVYEAKNLELDEKVALKTLRPELLVDKAMVGRFAREAKSAAAIKSEYVASVYDVGVTSDGLPYIVMEYLEGRNLGQVVEESGPLGARMAVEYALQICEALACAHAKGIVHRDIKPENLLLTERAGGMKIVKVLDFGISKTALTGSIFGGDLPIVKTVNLVGTPLYMSPEQVRSSDKVDKRSDIWSLGMVLYEILSGTTAFDEGSSITEICAAILEMSPKPIEAHRNDLPSGLVEVISRCLEKDAARRYQNVAELALALMPFGPRRSRLNVERAVAVLQGAGQVDPSLKVDTVMPPPSSGAPENSVVPRLPPPPSFGLGGETLAAPPSGPTSAANSSAAPAPARTNRTLTIIALIAVVLGVGGAGAVLGKRLHHEEPNPANNVSPPTTAASPDPPKTADPTVMPNPTKPETTATAAATPAPTEATPGGPIRHVNTTPGAFPGAVRPRNGTAGAAPDAAAAAAAAPVTSTQPAATPTATETSKGRTFRRDF